MIRKTALVGCAFTAAVLSLGLSACTVTVGSSKPAESPPPAPSAATAAPAAAAPTPAATPAPSDPATVKPSEPGGAPAATATTPAPAPTGSVVQNGASIQLPGKIAFDTGKATMSANSDNDAILEQLKNFLVQNDAKLAVLRIEGYTDNQGSADANLELSGQRALTIKNWLVAHGIDQSRLVAVGFGSDKPVAPNTTDDGRAQNRRTEFKVAAIFDAKRGKLTIAGRKASVYLERDLTAGGKEFK